MKKLLILIVMLCASQMMYGQCHYGRPYTPTQITGAVLIDWSMKSYAPTGFTGIGVHAGIWADHIGLFAGFTEAKLNEETIATRELVATIAIRYAFMDDRLVTCGSFSNGTHNYQDLSFRIGYDIWNNGIAVGAMVGRMMHYGISVNISMKHKN